MQNHSKVTTDEFNIQLEAIQKLVRETAVIKAKEYSSGTTERMYNFNRLADINETHPDTEAWHLMCKQFVSLQDMVFGKLQPTKELILEKCKDLHTYLHLIEAMLHERSKE